jgi:HSP20 family protein
VNFWRSWHNFCARIFRRGSSCNQSKLQKPLILQWFCIVPAVGISQAEVVLSEQKHLIKTKPKGKIMKLIQYERPGLAWPTFGRLANLQDELNHLFESPLRAWAPVLDVHEDADNFVIRAELPGLKRNDISVSLQDGALVISGERTVEKVEEGVEVHRQERFYGKFQRALTLPTPVAADKIKAQYKDGVLTVTLPKAEEAKPKQIDISVN